MPSKKMSDDDRALVHKQAQRRDYDEVSEDDATPIEIPVPREEFDADQVTPIPHNYIDLPSGSNEARLQAIISQLNDALDAQWHHSIRVNQRTTNRVLRLSKQITDHNEAVTKSVAEMPGVVLKIKIIQWFAFFTIATAVTLLSFAGKTIWTGGQTYGSLEKDVQYIKKIIEENKRDHEKFHANQINKTYNKDTVK